MAAVTLFTEFRQKIELRLDKVDVAFLVFEQLLENLHRHVVLRVVADVATPRTGVARLMFGGAIGFQNLLDVLPDPERRQRLHVREAFEEDDAAHELVRMMHFPDALPASYPLSTELAAP